MPIRKAWNWANARLHRKYVVGSATGLVLMSMMFYLVFIGMYRGQLEDERSKASAQMNQLLQATLENAMLKRDLDGLRGIVRRLGGQREITNTMILNPTGDVRFASTDKQLGQSFPGIGMQNKGSTVFTMDSEDRQVLRSINPVYNKDECVACHGSTRENPINGVLVVDYDASIIRTHARNTTLLLMAAGATIVFVTLIGSWWFMRQQVQKPINRLVDAHRRFSDGDLETTIEPRSNDELGVLAESFNRMAKRTAANLAEISRKELFLQTLLDGIPDGIRVIDRDYQIVSVNAAYLEQTGQKKEDSLGSPCYRVVHGRQDPCPPTLTSCPLYEIRQHPQPVKVLHRHRSVQGNPMDVEICAAPVYMEQDNMEQDKSVAPYIVEVIRDLKKTIRFSQEQRLSSLGELAAGVAHEIHNPLGSIQIAFRSLFHETTKDSVDSGQIEKYLKLVEGEIDNCVEVTNRLLKLSSTPGNVNQLIELNVAVADTVSLLKWEAQSKGIDASVELAADNPRVVASDSEMRMVVLNMVQNAFHAMPEGGTLVVKTSREDGSSVLRIADTGLGIADGVLPRIFDPFFSARADRQRGTGLGLAICKAIIDRAGGTIEADSMVGHGAVFTVALPDPDYFTDPDS